MATNRIFCSECGTANDPDAAFCESCGHALAQIDEPVVADEEVEYQDNVQEPPAGKRFSPKLLALVGVVVLAGAAYALRAPIQSMMGSSSTGDTTAVAADSLQLVTSDATPQLNDRATEDTQFVVTPEMLQRVTGGSQPTITMRPAPEARTSQQRAQQQQQQPTTQSQSQSATPSRPLPLPDAPPDFPDFKTPPATASAGPEASSGTTREAAAPVAAPGRIAAGSVLSLKSTSQICTDKTAQGAKFTAVVQQNVSGSNGATIPAGTHVTFIVDRLKRAQNANEKSEFSVAPQSIELEGNSYPLTATVDAVAIKQKSRSLLGALAGAAAAAAAAKAAGGDTKQTVAGGVM